MLMKKIFLGAMSILSVFLLAACQSSSAKTTVTLPSPSIAVQPSSCAQLVKSLMPIAGVKSRCVAQNLNVTGAVTTQTLEANSEEGGVIVCGPVNNGATQDYLAKLFFYVAKQKGTLAFDIPNYHGTGTYSILSMQGSTFNMIGSRSELSLSLPKVSLGSISGKIVLSDVHQGDMDVMLENNTHVTGHWSCEF